MEQLGEWNYLNPLEERDGGMLALLLPVSAGLGPMSDGLSVEEL